MADLKKLSKKKSAWKALFSHPVFLVLHKGRISTAAASVQLMLQLRQFLMRLHDCIFQLLINVTAALAGSFCLIAQLFQLIHALAYRFIILRLLELLPRLSRSLVQLLNTILQVTRYITTRSFTGLAHLVNGLLDLGKTLADFICLHHGALLFCDVAGTIRPRLDKQPGNEVPPSALRQTEAAYTSGVHKRQHRMNCQTHRFSVACSAFSAVCCCAP